MTKRSPVGGKSDKPGVLSVEIHRQPDDVTCGPTCLHAVYRYWGIDATLDEVVRSVRSLRHDGAGEGTLAVNLGVDALKRGMRATLYTFNLTVFDPTWFGPDGVVPRETLDAKLRAQAAVKAVDDRKFQAATEAYLEFGRLGGVVRLQDLTSGLISGHVRAGRPVLTGLSATYLYRASREYGPHDDEDDVRGLPQGHFVVLHGYDPKSRSVHVADPLDDNPGFAARNYTVPMARIVPSIMLGVLTYDANLLILEPKDGGSRDRAPRRTMPS